MYVSFDLVKHHILLVSFQIIVAFINYANVRDYKIMLYFPKWLPFTDHISE